MWDPREVRAATLPDLVRMCGPLVEELEVSILRQDQTTQQGARKSSDATPCMFRIGASNVKAEIVSVLRSMLGEWVLEQERPAFRMWTVPEMVARLGELRHWVVKHEQAEVWHERLLTQCLKGLDQIDIPPERVYIGRCPSSTCMVELWPTRGEEVMVCPGCKQQVDVRARVREGLRRLDRYEAPLSRIVEALRSAGEQITLEQARKWTQRTNARGRMMLVPRGKDQRGVKLYRLGDVRAVMTSTTRRRTKERR